MVKLRHKVGNLPLRKSVVKCKSYQSSFASFWKLMLPSTSPNEKKKGEKWEGGWIFYSEAWAQWFLHNSESKLPSPLF